MHCVYFHPGLLRAREARPLRCPAGPPRSRPPRRPQRAGRGGCGLPAASPSARRGRAAARS
eukprot:2413292-Pleurochrysis_carterae.AAC.1